MAEIVQEPDRQPDDLALANAREYGMRLAAEELDTAGAFFALTRAVGFTMAPHALDAFLDARRRGAQRIDVAVELLRAADGEWRTRAELVARTGVPIPQPSAWRSLARLVDEGDLLVESSEGASRYRMAPL